MGWVVWLGLGVSVSILLSVLSAWRASVSRDVSVSLYRDVLSAFCWLNCAMWSVLVVVLFCLFGRRCLVMCACCALVL